MSVTISTTESADQETWDEYVELSPHGTVFQRYGALEAQANHSNATLHPLVGYKGQEPIGIFPVFETHKGRSRSRSRRPTSCTSQTWAPPLPTWRS